MTENTAQNMIVEALQSTMTDTFDMEGSGSWHPVRAADFDAAAWGQWEAWEHCKVGPLPSGSVGAIPTGDWIAINFADGFHLGFRTRGEAEMMAVLQNQNAPTRVVSKDGTSETSALNFDEIHDRVEQQMLLSAAPSA